MKTEWIKFTDQKPRDYEFVLWYDSRDGFQHVGYFVNPTWPEYATHWMPLPPKPAA